MVLTVVFCCSPASGQRNAGRWLASHDISNHAVFKDNSGSRMPVNERIHNITVAYTNNAYVFREASATIAINSVHDETTSP